MFYNFLARIMTCWIPERKRRRNLRHKILRVLPHYYSDFPSQKEKSDFAKSVEQFKATNKDFLEHYMDKYELISLGSNCLSRTIPTRWGLRKYKMEGNLSGPFDLSMHDSEAIYKHIQNNFADYFENIIYEPTTKFWKNTSTNTIYNHDTDLTQLNDLKKRYQQRIKNFQQLAATDKTIFYVYNCNNGHIKEIIKAFEILKNSRKEKITKLIIISSFKLKFSINKDIYIINAPYPTYNYSWYEHFETKQGCKFEKKIVERIVKILKDTLITN